MTKIVTDPDGTRWEQLDLLGYNEFWPCPFLWRNQWINNRAGTLTMPKCDICGKSSSEHGINVLQLIWRGELK